jgi:hypothetical protein
MAEFWLQYPKERDHWGSLGVDAMYVSCIYLAQDTAEMEHSHAISSLRHGVQTGSEARPASSQMGTGG